MSAEFVLCLLYWALIRFDVHLLQVKAYSTAQWMS